MPDAVVLMELAHLIPVNNTTGVAIYKCSHCNNEHSKFVAKRDDALVR